MSNEIYLDHPNFGLLYRICSLGDCKELFTTLYAQRLFFVVTSGANGVVFEPVSRSLGRTMVEARLRTLRRIDTGDEFQKLQCTYKQTFQ